MNTTDVLIVDDDESLVSSYELLLGDHGFRGITARSGDLFSAVGAPCL
ncbi:MAG TPA: hypothetical protein VEO95_02720 [Chthoniobacteraceae bacterium]|nr:hypothetical protein [Chthoniobacteraceae bacterium]